MKKGKLVIASLLVLLTMTGCGGKKMTCTIEEKSLGMEMKGTVNISFKGDKFSSAKAKMDITLPDSLKDQKDTMLNSFKNSNEMKDVKVKETKNGFRLTGQLSAEDLGIDDDVSYADAKKELEAGGYKCK